VITPKHILLVESSPKDAQLLQTAFVAAQIPNPIEVVTSEESAMDYLQRDGAPLSPSQLPVLTILALPLPIFNNFRLLRWIRSQPDLGPMPIFVLAGVAISEEDVRAHQLGSNSYGEKPTDFGETIRLAKFLEEKFLKPKLGGS
jgi:DNA-binding response OmpR family regulator